jgi:hypothetical protein
MRKIALFILTILLTSIAYADDYVEGKKFDEYEISQWDRITAPSVSPSGAARAYYDATLNYMLLSENGGAYSRLCTLSLGALTYLLLDQSGGAQTVTGGIPVFDAGITVNTSCSLPYGTTAGDGSTYFDFGSIALPGLGDFPYLKSGNAFNIGALQNALYIINEPTNPLGYATIIFSDPSLSYAAQFWFNPSGGYDGNGTFSLQDDVSVNGYLTVASGVLGVSSFGIGGTPNINNPFLLSQQASGNGLGNAYAQLISSPIAPDDGYAGYFINIDGYSSMIVGNLPEIYGIRCNYSRIGVSPIWCYGFYEDIVTGAGTYHGNYFKSPTGFGMSTPQKAITLGYDKEFATELQTPTNLTISALNGGSLTDGSNYVYRVSAALRGETAASTSVNGTAVAPDLSLVLDWDDVTGAKGYYVYVNKDGAGWTLLKYIAGSTNSTYTDDGSDAPGAGTPPEWSNDYRMIISGDTIDTPGGLYNTIGRILSTGLIWPVFQLIDDVNPDTYTTKMLFNGNSADIEFEVNGTDIWTLNILSSLMTCAGGISGASLNSDGTLVTVGDNTLGGNTTFGANAGSDITLTFNTNTSDGSLQWIEASDYFNFADDIFLTASEYLYFGGTDNSIMGDVIGNLGLNAGTKFTITTPSTQISNYLLVGSTSFGGALMEVNDTTLDTAAAFALTKSYAVKTAGATDANDSMWAHTTIMEMDDTDSTIGNLYSFAGTARLTNGTIGTGVANRHMYGLTSSVEANAGTLIQSDDDQGIGGTSYMLYLNELTGVDYGIYQNGTATNLLNGSLTVGAGLYIRDDADLITLGTGGDMSIQYTGVVGRIDTSLVAPSDLQIDCGTDKTFVLDESVWEDIQFPIETGKVPAANYPTYEAFTSANIEAYAFSVDDKIQLSSNEPPHGWVEGSVGSAHVHFALKTAQVTGSDRFLKLELIFAYSDYNGIWVEQAAITQEETITNGAVALQSYLTTFGTTVTLTGLHIGSQIKCRVRRIAATGGTEYADDVYITQVGVHVEKVRLGSRTVSSA